MELRISAKAMLATRWYENGLRKGILHTALQITELPIKLANIIIEKKVRRKIRKPVASWYCSTPVVPFVAVVVLSLVGEAIVFVES